MPTASTRTLTTRAGLTALSLAAAAALTFRIERASELGWLESATSVGTALLVSATFAAGWRIHARKLRARAEAAEWETARLRRNETLLDGDEDQELWDSVPAAATNMEDTCAFGTVVVPINRFRYPQAG